MEGLVPIGAEGIACRVHFVAHLSPLLGQKVESIVRTGLATAMPPVVVMVATRVKSLVLLLKMVDSPASPFAHRWLAHWEIAIMAIVHHIVRKFDLLLPRL